MHYRNYSHHGDRRLRIMVFNATFNNVSDISWWSNLLVEGTRVPRENHWPVASHWQILSHNVVFKYTSPWDRFNFTTLVVIGTDCIGSCKFNYHTITTMTAWYSPDILAWEQFILYCHGNKFNNTPLYSVQIQHVQQ